MLINSNNRANFEEETILPKMIKRNVIKEPFRENLVEINVDRTINLILPVTNQEFTHRGWARESLHINPSKSLVGKSCSQASIIASRRGTSNLYFPSSRHSSETSRSFDSEFISHQNLPRRYDPFSFRFVSFREREREREKKRERNLLLKSQKS